MKNIIIMELLKDIFFKGISFEIIKEEIKERYFLWVFKLS